MQYKIFTMPVNGNEIQMEEMNAFLRGYKIVKVDKQVITLGDNVFWTFCVQYLLPVLPAPISADKKDKIDYRKILDEEHFKVFSLLRLCRKKIAESDAVPAYAVFTDAEIAEIAKLETIDEASMRKINGIGEKHVEKYGKLILEMMNEKNWESSESNS